MSSKQYTDKLDNYESARKVSAGVHAKEEWAMAELYDRLLSIRWMVENSFRRDKSFQMDVLHDSYVEIVNAIHRRPLRDGRALMSFCHCVIRCQIAQRIAANSTRRNAEQLCGSFDWIDRREICDSYRQTQLDVLLDAEQREIAVASLQELQPNHREIIERSCLAEQPEHEIRQVMGLSPAQLWHQRTRAKARLGAIARQKYESPALSAA